MKNLKLFYPLIIILLLLSSLGFSGNGALQYQQVSGSWSMSVALSDSQGFAWFPDVIGDTTGRVHVVWSGATVGYDQVIYTNTMDGVKWSKPNDVLAIAQKTSTYSDASRPALWVDQKGLLNIAYGSSKKFLAQSPISTAGSAGSWTQPLVVNGNQESYFSSLTVDDKGVLHIVYSENQPSNNCAICYHLYHRASSDYGQTWTDPKDITAANNGSAKPQLIAGRGGKLFVVYESGIGGSLGSVQDPTLVQFMASYDQGKTWTPPVQLSPSNVKISKNVTIGLDSKGTLVVVWLDSTSNQVYYQTSKDSGKNWSQSSSIAGIYGAWDIYPSFKDDYSMAADSQGNLHLLMVGKVKDYQNSLSLLHLTWNGSDWSDPDEITRIVGDVPEWPRIAVSQGNVLNAVWFVRDQANIWKSDNGHYRVWYARKVISAPAIPTIIPKMTATPAPTSANAVIPTAVLNQDTTLKLPTLAPADKAPTNVLYTENDYLKVMALAILPVVLFIILVVVVIIIRRGSA